LSQITEKLPKPVLGRGLSALIPQARGSAAQSPGKQSLILFLPVESIHRDGNQPRKVFKEERLRELAESMRTQGLIQPVLVRKDETGYRLIAGERRWRAAQLAGMHEVPAIVREASDAEAFELALVENLQRADLNPIEEAEGYRRLMTDYSFTQEQVSHRVAKDRSSVATALRLLGLPREVKEMLADGDISMGHARALLGLAEESLIVEVAKKVAANSLSVREAENLVRRKKSSPEVAAKPEKSDNPHARQVVDDLQRRLGTKVRLLNRGGKGTLEISFFSYDDLDRLIGLLQK
jgi:ParB family chromosome partitioning protein